MRPVLLTDFYSVMLGAMRVNSLVLVQFLGDSSFFNGRWHFNSAALLALFSAPVMIAAMLLNTFILQLLTLNSLALTIRAAQRCTFSAGSQTVSTTGTTAVPAVIHGRRQQRDNRSSLVYHAEKPRTAEATGAELWQCGGVSSNPAGLCSHG